ncbi:MAG TPA: chromosome segregation protein SMC [Gammaproteobacteria bacterium]|nr:chromosome segregation protein SMC [Gammaproteobacteria bacterium]
MRLDKIKLAGFKSFVDPTVLELRSPLVAVVGPNGCGKSNIIDAIRWVMGESSAKNLRGESMADVIFNGSSTRKPVGQATIELVFDNSDGSLGGEYARFAEISIKRQGTRDGQSAYFLNGTRCRRKDITDVFLGTGLGPRSYAIIEQGMISRVIEARPEELRAFFEEAAGISLYRKRRHETEIRMRHTRENLERLSDLRQELEKQLERLKRQSESAVRYQEYKIEHDRLEAELAALRWQVYNQKLQERAAEIRNLSIGLEEKLAMRTSLDLALEKQRILHTEKMDSWKIEQAEYYDLGTQIARIEQALQYHRERETALESDFSLTEQSYQRAGEQQRADEDRLSALKVAFENLEPNLESAKDFLEKSLSVQIEADEAMRNWNQSFEAFQQAAENPQRTAEVEKARIEQLERQSRDAKAQLDRLQREYADIDVARLEQNIAALEEERLEKTSTTNSASTLGVISTALIEARDLIATKNQRLDALRGQLQTGLGRLASLEALQQAALGKTNDVVQGWLKSHNLLEAERLGQVLSVEPGYERAVETVLGSALEALCVPGIPAIAALVGELPSGNLAFIGADSFLDRGADHANRPDSLASKIKTDYSMDALFAGITVTDELLDALNKQKSLKAGESVVTREGIWLGSNWLKVFRGNDGHSGVLAREAELKALTALIEMHRSEIADIEVALAAAREEIANLEQKREECHQAQQAEARILNELTSKISTDRARLEHQRTRMARLLSESADQRQKLDLAEEETAISRLHLQTALDAMEGFTKQRVLLQAERDNLRDVVRNANQNASEAKEKAHALALKEQTLVTQIKAIAEGLQRLEQQQEVIEERKIALQTQLQALNEPKILDRMRLDELLEKHVIAEDLVNQSRTALDALELEGRSLEKQRNVLEADAQRFRSELEEVKMDWQAIEVRCQTIQEQFGETANIAQVLQTVPLEATEPVWAESLEQVTKRIERLGAINMAAIEEYQSESERKLYLDSQNKDLTEALETLENAIRKIDKETRERFKDTFDKVNTQFKILFPILFGGGQANLELMGEDILEAGVTVMARPPGKRNSSIHLLSGGEKALTAVALVFAIFQLNPAPFCLLDEVDAPLDDANVVRFCDLVKKLSETVQFIFISHNKLAMEIAHHLVGVTMKEPGVSRLVSVDVEEAVALVG